MTRAAPSEFPSGTRLAIGSSAVFIGIFILVFALLFFRTQPTTPSFTLMPTPPLLPHSEVETLSAHRVIGHLGGLPVALPPEFATTIEYDDDPGFRNRQDMATTARTAEAGIRSLGFAARYPDFSITTRKERDALRRRHTIFNTPWIDIGITASTHFGDGLFLERTHRHLDDNPHDQYGRLPQRLYGLETYTPIRADRRLRAFDPVSGSYRSNFYDRDKFFHFSESGKVETYIVCSNREHDAAPCRHSFYLDPQYRILVTALYRRGMLEHWRGIETGIRSLMAHLRPQDGLQSAQDNSQSPTVDGIQPVRHAFPPSPGSDFYEVVSTQAREPATQEPPDLTITDLPCTNDLLDKGTPRENLLSADKADPIQRDMAYGYFDALKEIAHLSGGSINREVNFRELLTFNEYALRSNGIGCGGHPQHETADKGAEQAAL